MDKFFPLYVNVINGEVQEFPVLFHFKKSMMVPVGETVIRYFNDDMCSLARKTFYIQYGADLFGSDQFKTKADFYQWLGYNIRGECYLLLDSCNLQMNGCSIII